MSFLTPLASLILELPLGENCRATEGGGHEDEDASQQDPFCR